MPRTAMVWNQPLVKLATTQAGLTAGAAVECQITSCELEPQPTSVSIPSTGCAGASESPGLTGYSLVLNWLEDWKNAAAASLSKFAWTNDGLPVWVLVQPDKTDVTVKMEGQFYCVTGGFGATFGDGSAAETTATWPAVAKPAITSPA